MYNLLETRNISLMFLYFQNYSRQTEDKQTKSRRNVSRIAKNPKCDTEVRWISRECGAAIAFFTTHKKCLYRHISYIRIVPFFSFPFCGDSSGRKMNKQQLEPKNGVKNKLANVMNMNIHTLQTRRVSYWLTSFSQPFIDWKEREKWGGWLDLSSFFLNLLTVRFDEELCQREINVPFHPSFSFSSLVAVCDFLQLERKKRARVYSCFNSIHATVTISSNYLLATFALQNGTVSILVFCSR